MGDWITYWLVPIFVIMLGLFAGYLLHMVLMRTRAAAEFRAGWKAVEQAKMEIDALRREAEIAAREEVVKVREAFETENASRRRHLTVAEERLAAQQADLDRRAAMLEKKEFGLEAGREEIRQQEEAAEAARKDAERAAIEVQAKLTEVAALPRDEARRLLLDRLDSELSAEQVSMIRRHQEEARRGAEDQAREIITAAIERFAADQVNSVTTCTITLPDDEMKGRIIGREGRNIRSLETETGCTIVIDDTPRTVVVSGFDPLRREVARRTIEALVADGRIHPARIEEIATQIRTEVEDIIRKAGESAAEELQLTGIDPELFRQLGSLQFRHSFSQNVLRHSVEMAHLMGMMASELGLDPALARRVGLFHDLGKAVDHKVEGTHAAIGADLLRRHGEAPVVWQAVAAHHHEAEGGSIYASLASAADAITAARPGARSETTEIYLRRLAKLEEIACGFPGVKNCYAVHAGREIRVFVLPDQVDDTGAMILARNISRKIHTDMQFPGQIKVTVIRETRCVEYAH
ncbi:MAG: ribonuclease Y [Verrucomicrobia bacterium]|nr:ribonuclease Y [Verrucomicrobiota bacterium]